MISFLRNLIKGKGTPANGGGGENQHDKASPVGRHGIFMFKEQQGSTSGAVDIIALHGLNGHYRDTWTSPVTGSNWLIDEGFLPSQIPNARIMSYGYNSQVELSKSTADIGAFAEGLLYQLQTWRRTAEEKKRPIIFICHSLGGIVAKKVS
jgi:hypothetical protein